MALIDFTLSNARRFYSSMGSPSGVKGLTLHVGEANGSIQYNTKLLVSLVETCNDCNDNHSLQSFLLA